MMNLKQLSVITFHDKTSCLKMKRINNTKRYNKSQKCALTKENTDAFANCKE